MCNDNGLVDFINDETKDNNRFQTYPSIPDFESVLKLHLEKINEELIAELTENARKLFYDPGSPLNSLYNKWDLENKVQSKFKDKFNEPELSIGFGVILSNRLQGIDGDDRRPITGGSFEISPPVFVVKHGVHNYIWENIIVYKRRYKKVGLISSLAADELRDYIIEFKVEWKLMVNEVTGKVSNPELIKVNYSSNRAESVQSFSTFPNYLGSVPLTSGATLSGQGTISASPSPSPSPLDEE